MATRKPKRPFADDEHYDMPFESLDVPEAAYSVPYVPVDRKDRIEDVDLSNELLKQFYDLQDLILKNAKAPLNQQAQIAGVLATVTARIIQNQKDLHDIEKVKLIESVLIEVLQEFPSIRAEFLDRYQQELENAERALATRT